MLIANPIYDVVFKYLMEDKEVAILLISEILGENVIDLEFKPQELVASAYRDPYTFTIYRMDFSAKIQQPDQQFKQVIIEIQKAKLHTDIMRFRNYLGMQYANKENVVVEHPGENPTKHALPLHSIYFLGHRLEHIETPIIQVKRAYLDGSTGELIQEREEFIESLTHDSVVIQIPQLRADMRTDLEKLLSVFNQSYVATKDKHILEINDAQFPEKYRKVLRRLVQAHSEPEVRQNMEVEDEFFEELQEQERKVQVAEEKAWQAQQRAEQEKQRAEQEKQRAERSDQKAEQEKQRAEQEKQRAEHLMELLKKHGIDPQ